jgi:hypothetical protein
VAGVGGDAASYDCEVRDTSGGGMIAWIDRDGRG